VRGRLVHIGPVLAEASDDIGSGAFASKRFEHEQTLIVILLLVPSDFLLAAFFILFHHAVLGRLEFERGDIAGLILSGSGKRNEKQHTEGCTQFEQFHIFLLDF
jgi:hypothetical protein